MYKTPSAFLAQAHVHSGCGPWQSEGPPDGHAMQLPIEQQSHNRHCYRYALAAGMSFMERVHGRAPCFLPKAKQTVPLDW